jgi:hypothetical protein
VMVEELTLVNVDDTFYNTSLTSDTVS